MAAALHPYWGARALLDLGLVATRLALESTAMLPASGDDPAVIMARMHLGCLAAQRQRPFEAQTHFEAALALARGIGQLRPC